MNVDWLGKVILLAYPRSGSTWLRYVIEHCTGESAPNPGDPLTNYAYARFGEPSTHLVDPRAKPLVTKVHHVDEIEGLSVDSGPLVLLVRSPFENIPGFLYAESRPDMCIQEWCGTLPTNAFNSRANWYFENIIEGYRINDTGSPTHIVYYEDLIGQPRETIANLMIFLGHPGSESNVMDNYDDHRGKCLGYAAEENAKRDGMRCNTWGKQVELFRQHLPIGVKRAIWRHANQYTILHRYL